MTVDFRAYLDAKYALDSRSLNREVWETLQQALTRKRKLRCLDLGTGTGAMPKRLIDLNLEASLDITGIDIDAGLLDIALERLPRRLRELGFRTENRDSEICAYRKDKTIRIRFECASVLDWTPQENLGHFDLISAHAFMDIMPLQPVTRKILELLAPAGIFYSTLNYDGETVLIPVYSDEDYERKVLEHYDRSMETRRIHGMPTGGAKSGRRLASILAASGLAINSYGSSDWNIIPINGFYRYREAFCLKSLLAMIHGEAFCNGALNTETLAAWYADRSSAIDAGRLGMIVHQLDILAVKSPRPWL